MNEDIRETIHSVEYDEYYASLDEKTKAKYDYVEMIIVDHGVGSSDHFQESVILIMIH